MYAQHLLLHQHRILILLKCESNEEMLSLINSSFYAEAQNRMEVEKHETGTIPEVNQKLSDFNENERGKKKKR